WPRCRRQAARFEKTDSSGSCCKPRFCRLRLFVHTRKPFQSERQRGRVFVLMSRDYCNGLPIHSPFLRVSQGSVTTFERRCLIVDPELGGRSGRRVEPAVAAGAGG